MTPKQLDRVIDRISDLDIVLAIGVMGDWVVLSLGGSAAHLEKLVRRSAGRASPRDEALRAAPRGRRGQGHRDLVCEQAFEAILSPTGDDLRMLAHCRPGGRAGCPKAGGEGPPLP